MPSIEEIKKKAHSLPLRTEEKVLVCLAEGEEEPKRVAQIRKVALTAGFTSAKGWNISRELGKLKGLAIRTTSGWEITPAGREKAKELLGEKAPRAVTDAAADEIRKHLKKIKDANTQEFLEEAVSCLENGQGRAAVVLSWVGAVSVLQNEVADKHLPAFNAEASRRDSKWKAAKNTDDLGKMKEADFLVILEAIGVIGKNVKQELEGSLKLRNGSGHPNSLKVGKNKVAAHIETLVQNVFAKFS